MIELSQEKQVSNYSLVMCVCLYLLSAPSGPPLSVTINSTGPRSLSLSWSPPNNQLLNGIITSYTYYCTEGSTSTNVTVGTVTSTSTEVYFNSLEPYTIYACFVSAETSAGSGPAANAIGRTAEYGKVY